ncbi:MAG: hypothetical protein U5R06_07420 [candidate division KSB1 bacterium]|nr:hypothetical protein [candidate division KSB1 bacterium]
MGLDYKYKKSLEKILNSQEFSHSKIYQQFLRYLVHASSEGEAPKETTIAIDVFGKDSSFNPAEDTTVRSHIYTLRKKLQSYYYSEGRKDKYRLRIPKGHYEAKFVPNVESIYHPKNIVSVLKTYYHWLIIAALCALVFLLWQQNQSLEQDIDAYTVLSESDPVWQEYLSSEKSILVILGNHFFFDEYSEKYEEFIAMRHPKVNSMQDFEAYRKRRPGVTYQVTNEPYFPYHSIWSLPPVLELFYSVHKRPILRKSSEISPQILDEYHILFLGSIKTLYKLKHTLLKSNFDFEISPHKVFYTDPESGKRQVFETTLHSPGPNEDLVLALKLPGPDNNSIFIIASYHSLGAPEISKFMTSLSMRKPMNDMLMQKYGKIPQYFEALFRVTGIDKTAYNTEILILNKITSDDIVTAAARDSLN